MLLATNKAIFMDNAILVCAKTKYVIKHNIYKVKTNREPITPIVAECNCSAAKIESADFCCPPDENYHQQECHIRLTSNLWTEASLGVAADLIIVLVRIDDYY